VHILNLPSEANVKARRFSEVIDDRVVLMPKKLVDKSQAYFWTKRWQEGEREADEDIKAGRVKVFDSVELVKDSG